MDCGSENRGSEIARHSSIEYSIEIEYYGGIISFLSGLDLTFNVAIVRMVCVCGDEGNNHKRGKNALTLFWGCFFPNKTNPYGSVDGNIGKRYLCALPDKYGACTICEIDLSDTIAVVGMAGYDGDSGARMRRGTAFCPRSVVYVAFLGGNSGPIDSDYVNGGKMDEYDYSRRPIPFTVLVSFFKESGIIFEDGIISNMIDVVVFAIGEEIKKQASGTQKDELRRRKKQVRG